jgi:hypothetical protein
LPPIPSPNDWDRLFRPNAPRRGGPLRALANLLLVGAAVALLGGGTFFALRFGFERARQSAAQTAAASQTSYAARVATVTARALGTPTAGAAASAATPTAAPLAVIGRSSVVNSGNLRSQPVVAPETVVGQICAGDQLDVLEQTDAGGGTWYRVRVTQAGASCTPQRVTVGSIGWASGSLLAPVTP